MPRLGDSMKTMGSDNLDSVMKSFWDYADRHHDEDLDGGRRTGRVPVLARQVAGKNVLLPPTAAESAEISLLIPVTERHRWFGSSQALTQSVFGTVVGFKRLDLLTEVRAENGRQAFFDTCQDCAVELDHEVKGLSPNPPSRVVGALERDVRGKETRLSGRIWGRLVQWLPAVAVGRCSWRDRRQRETLAGPSGTSWGDV